MRVSGGDFACEISINLSILDFKSNINSTGNIPHFAINLSILDFKSALVHIIESAKVTINLSILDFK